MTGYTKNSEYSCFAGLTSEIFYKYSTDEVFDYFYLQLCGEYLINCLKWVDPCLCRELIFFSQERKLETKQAFVCLLTVPDCV